MQYSQILPHIYVGPELTFGDEVVLNMLEITDVLSVIDTSYYVPPNFAPENRFHIYLADSRDSKLGPHINNAVEFIDKAIKSGGNVYIHCRSGRSRSVGIVIAYLLSKRVYTTYHEALAFVRAQRPSANPNEGFAIELDWFAEPEPPLYGPRRSRRLRTKARQITSEI